MMKVFFVSLGCDKNRVDSENMLGLLNSAGFSFTDDAEDADIIIINSCCFIDDAKIESIDTILEMAEYKEYGLCKYLIVAGCLSERYKDEFSLQFPEVDAIIGTNEPEKLLEQIKELLEQDEASDGKFNFDKNDLENSSRIITTPGHYEFLKIADGCNKMCTYCIIPYIRGRYVSYPMDKLYNEAKALAENGVTELIIVAQESSIYGSDLYGSCKLPELLKKLCSIEKLKWIRLLYCYPEDITDELLELIASEDKICKYIDMPIQHASDPVLKRMGRKTTISNIRNIISKARSVVPGIVLRTTIISGFPGETEEDHKAVLDLVKEIRFDRLGVFTYSAEEGTPAEKFPDQIDDEVKKSRRDEIMSEQELISYENLTSCISHIYDVIVDGYLADEDVYVGRTYMDAPEVDGAVFFKSDRNLYTGDYVRCEIINCSNYDLYGEVIE